MKSLGAEKLVNQHSRLFVRQLPWVLFLTSIFLLNFTARVIFSPLLPVLEKEFALSHAAAGSLFVYLSSGYFIALVGSGFLSARVSHRLILGGSAIGCGLVLLFAATSRSLVGLRFSVLLVGLACGCYLPSAIAVLTDMIEKRHWGKALAVHELAPNLAFTLAPLLAALLLPFCSWRLIIVWPGVISILLGVLFLVLVSGGRFHGEAPSLLVCRLLIKQPAFWVLIILFTLGIASTMGLYNILPVFLVSHLGMDHSAANKLLSLSRVFSLGSVFLGGWATDRIGIRRTVAVVFSVSGLLTLFLGFVPGSVLPLAAALVFCQPLLAVSFFPAGFAAIARVSSPESRNLAVALVVPLAFLLGGGFVPYAIALCGDAGRFAWGIIGLGLLVVSGAALVFMVSFNDDSKLPSTIGK